MMKFIVDILFACIALILLIPILLIIAILLLIIERKAVLFIQPRIGKNKQEFQIYKFRTIWNNKITPLGRILRKTGIDELPQLFNIVKGDMSFVGPRPLTQADIERLGWNTEFYEKRWQLRPGIVGLAQLSPICHKKMSWFYDQLYLKKQSLFLDFKIVLAATVIPFVGKKTLKSWIHGKQ